MSVKIDTLIKLLPWLVANPGKTARQIAAEFGIKPDDVLDAVQLLVVTGPNPREGGGCVDIDFYAPDDDDFDHDGDVKRDFDVAITVIDPQKLDRPIKLDPLSAASIVAGLNFIQSLPGLVDPAFVQQLLEKIQGASGIADAPISVASHDEIESKLATLRSAISHDTCVEIEYASGSDERISRREIEPKALLTRDDIVYVRAYCLEAESARTFRVDRILSIEPSSTVQGHNVDVEDERVTAPLVHEVCLRIENEYLYEFNQHSGSAPKELPDGRFEVVTSVGSVEWLVGQVLASGGSIEVVSPPEMRNRVSAAVQGWKHK